MYYSMCTGPYFWHLVQALASELEEEDDLTHALEREQDAAISSAIEEEQSYLKAIEREESTEIVVDDADLEQGQESELEVWGAEFEASCPVGLPSWVVALWQYTALVRQ